MENRGYLMESEEEACRLDLKTDPKTVERQALWAGVRPGMRVADLGCGSGKTTFCLNQLVGPKGETIGIDNAEQRIEYARKHYPADNITYILKDIRTDLNDLGTFDFLFVRFVLEYYRSNSFEILKNINDILAPGGILCLIDLDYNCLTHFGLPPRLESALEGIRKQLQEKVNFDPYAGRKLYAYLYDLEFENIAVDLEAHHLIFGELNEIDAFNWTKKVELGSKMSEYLFDDYPGGYAEFYDEFKTAFANPRRFTYTPVILCRGTKPV
jgi:ubiquinone/menaquinone biosynthesis C-methylase UbiE